MSTWAEMTTGQRDAWLEKAIGNKLEHPAFRYSEGSTEDGMGAAT